MFGEDSKQDNIKFLRGGEWGGGGGVDLALGKLISTQLNIFISLKLVPILVILKIENCLLQVSIYIELSGKNMFTITSCLYS